MTSTLVRELGADPPERAGTLPDPTATTSSTRSVPLAVALVAASLPMFMATLDNLVMTGALPVIQRSLGASIGELEWFLNAYTLSFATLMLAATTLGDRWGRRRVFVAGIALFTLASIASALSSSPEMLIAARALQGAGGAAIMPLSLTLLAGAVPRERRAMAIGVWGGVSGLGVALGPLVGGAVVEGLSWQAIFWINVPVALVAIPLVRFALGESFGRREPLDGRGLALIGAGVLALVWGTVRGNDEGWTSSTVLGAFATGAVLVGLFVHRQWRSDHPLVPLRLFTSRSFVVANLTGLAFSVGMFGSVFLLVQALQVQAGFSPLEAGVRTLPWTAAPMIVAPIAGMLAPRLGVRVLLASGLAAQALGLAWIALLAGADMAYPDLVPAFVLAGIGMGLTFAPSSTAVLADMPDVDHAVASSTNSTIREIGVALGVAVLAAVFQARGGSLTPEGFTAGLRPAIMVGAAVVALGAIAALALPRHVPVVVARP